MSRRTGAGGAPVGSSRGPGILRAAALAITVMSLALGVPGCGGDNLCVSGCDATPTPTPGAEDFVAVRGMITEHSTFDPVQDIVVIACVDLPPTATNPTDWNDCPSQENTSADTSGSFEMTRVQEGALRIGFWISRSATPNGMIQDGDSFAELLDPDGALTDVRMGQTVTLSSVAVDFGDGEAEAGSINVARTATPTPQAGTTPTP